MWAVCGIVASRPILAVRVFCRARASGFRSQIFCHNIAQGGVWLRIARQWNELERLIWRSMSGRLT